MAKFLEYQGKEWLAKGGMPVPKGRVASSPEEAEDAARWIGGPVAVKGQVQAGGRGKAGIVKLADTPEEARALAEEILAKTVKGLPVEKVLIEEKLDIKKEYYCSFVNAFNVHAAFRAEHQHGAAGFAGVVDDE